MPALVFIVFSAGWCTILSLTWNNKRSDLSIRRLVGAINAVNFRKGQRREEPEINLIAFIDVLLVILIFLMLSTTYSKYTALQITLSTANAEQPTEAPRTVVVAVDAQGRYEINARLSEARDPGSLAQAMKEAVNGNADAVVEVHADVLASHQFVIHVFEAARLAGLERVRFSAQSQKK